MSSSRDSKYSSLSSEEVTISISDDEVSSQKSTSQKGLSDEEIARSVVVATKRLIQFLESVVSSIDSFKPSLFSNFNDCLTAAIKKEKVDPVISKFQSAWSAYTDLHHESLPKESLTEISDVVKKLNSQIDVANVSLVNKTINPQVRENFAVICNCARLTTQSNDNKPKI